MSMTIEIDDVQKYLHLVNKVLLILLVRKFEKPNIFTRLKVLSVSRCVRRCSGATGATGANASKWAIEGSRFTKGYRAKKAKVYLR